MANNRSLLDRLNGLMTVNIALIDDPTIEYTAVLRMIDARKLCEAAEVARVLCTSVRGSDATPNNDERQGASGSTPMQAGVAGAIGTDGRSCWTRHMLAAAAHEAAKSVCVGDRDALDNAYTGLNRALYGVRRIVVTSARNAYNDMQRFHAMQHVHELPGVHRDFYALIDATLAQ